MANVSLKSQSEEKISLNFEENVVGTSISKFPIKLGTDAVHYCVQKLIEMEVIGSDCSQQLSPLSISLGDQMVSLICNLLENTEVGTDYELLLEEEASRDEPADMEKSTIEMDSNSLKKPCCIIVLGMAGSGKTTFVRRIVSELSRTTKPYVINLDPACLEVPYPVNIGLKAALLHNENKLPSTPLAYACDMKETYENLEKILRLINYSKHKWQIVSDLKVLTILFGMQGGYTKHPCYLCKWDSRVPNKYARAEWPARQLFRMGQKNVLNPLLVRPENVILPPLPLKLGYAKQFLKKLKADSEAFRYLKEVAFPKLSDAKLKGGILTGPQIRQLMRDEEFVSNLNSVERREWRSFVSLCENFLGNKKSPDYVEVVNEFLSAYEAMGCNMSIKVYFVQSHLDFFPENLGNMSDEQGERFHQEIRAMEKRFQATSSINKLADFCLSIKRETSAGAYKRKRTSKHY